MTTRVKTIGFLARIARTQHGSAGEALLLRLATDPDGIGYMDFVAARTLLGDLERCIDDDDENAETVLRELEDALDAAEERDVQRGLGWQS